MALTCIIRLGNNLSYLLLRYYAFIFLIEMGVLIVG